MTTIKALKRKLITEQKKATAEFERVEQRKQKKFIPTTKQLKAEEALFREFFQEFISLPLEEQFAALERFSEYPKLLKSQKTIIQDIASLLPESLYVPFAVEYLEGERELRSFWNSYQAREKINEEIQ